MRLPFIGGVVKADSAAFVATVDGDELLLSASRGGCPLPVAEWPAAFPKAIGALAEIHTAAEDDRVGADQRRLVEVATDHIRLRPAFVASLDALSAVAVGIPAATSLALDLKPRGRIDEEDFHIDLRWVRPGGQPVQALLAGAILKADGVQRRVPEPIWSLYQAAKALSTPLEKVERFRALAELHAHWPNDSQANVQSDRYLQDLRVHYASSLSLKLKALTPDETRFDPVLFGSRSLAAADDEGRAPDEELDSVLTPSAQKIFAEQRFRADQAVRPVYVLRNGEYVFIDPSLRPALGEVRRLQDEPEAVRRKFVLNPTAVLRERLGEETAERIGLDFLFVETEQFSARVAGVDVWRAPVLPWLTPAGNNQWLPERFGLRVGDDYFIVAPGNAARVIDQVEAAARDGRETADVEGLLDRTADDGPEPPKSLPVNDHTLAAVRSLGPFARSSEGAGDQAGFEEGGAVWDAETRGMLFLVVRENFEEVEFAALGDDTDAVRPDISSVEPPKPLRATLKAHQREGLSWLAHCTVAHRPGALLADDMGLGKTLQAIAFMAWLQAEASVGRRAAAPFLIVAPTGLLGTWRDEIVKHLDRPCLGPVVPAFGADLKTLREDDGFSARDIETGKASLRAAAWRDAGVVLTTYETLRDYHFSFARTRFGLIVYDEIQKLKNPTSQMTRAAKALNGDFTLGMTGTPVENRLQDLWSIMDIVAPGLLGASRDFDRRYSPDDRAALAGLKSLLTESRDGRPPYMLRRLKGDVLEGLPGKMVHPFETDMPVVQANAYHDLVIRAAAGAANGSIGKGGMLSLLAEMRGISLHPLDPRHAPADLDLYAQDSARLSRALSILDAVAAKKEKALIFVEDLAMQERLAGLIQSRFGLDAPPMRINGTVPGPKRQAMVDAFQKNRDLFDVMILSPKAGGVGLTLTSANHVIHLSRWWNPAVEDQATDRVYRIGQGREVHVYIPMAVHPDPAIRPSSFDLRLNALMERKRQLTRDLFLPTDADEADLSELFREVSLGVEASTGGSLAKATESAGYTRPTIDQGSGERDAPPPRPRLSLSKTVVESGARVWLCQAGEPRPTAEVLNLFRDKDLPAVRIKDPYALATRGQREAQVRFLAELSKVSRSIGRVMIEYAPETEPDVGEPSARREIGSLISVEIPRSTPALTLSRRYKKARDDDFHDRVVEIEVRHAGGAVHQHTLLLGRGVEALFDTRWQCTVAYAPPSASLT